MVGILLGGAMADKALVLVSLGMPEAAGSVFRLSP